jgi:hypothetical protein
MRRLPVTLLLLTCISGAASAQLPLPLPGEPELLKKPECSRAYVRSVEDEISGMEKLRASGPALVGHICALIETGSALVGGELSEGARQKIKGLLGVDVDLRFITMQCRVSQGNLDREMMSRIGYLKSELLRCDGTI